MEDQRRKDIIAFARILGVGEKSIPCYHCNGSCPGKVVGECFGGDFGLGLQTREAPAQIEVAEENASDC